MAGKSRAGEEGEVGIGGWGKHPLRFSALFCWRVVGSRLAPAFRLLFADSIALPLPPDFPVAISASLPPPSCASAT